MGVRDSWRARQVKRRAKARARIQQGPRAQRRYHRRRFLLGAFIAVLASAFATTCIYHGEIDQLASAIGTNKAVKIQRGVVAPAAYGQPETILLIGNDQRKARADEAAVLPHSNEMLLIRLDPNEPWISMMSIPRELQATFPTSSSGFVTTRLNATMQYGGINLTVKTITKITGITINHVVAIDFGNFRKAINDMGCVYGQIDRRYYHRNVPGEPAIDNYFQINLHPGYQRLCGNQALQFVTYRHGDTASVRDARDQDFMMEIKQEYGPSLLSNIGKFEHIFGELVQTDGGLHTATGVENLVGTLIASAGKPVRQVPWRTDLDSSTVPGCTCDVSSARQIKESVDSFLYGTYSAPQKKKTTALAKKIKKKKITAGVAPVPAGSLAYARSQAHKLSFPLEFPSIEVDNGYGFPVDIRNYRIEGPNGVSYPAYVASFSTGLLGQYYDVQGTTWLNAPILSSSTDSITVAGRTYYLYYTGGHILQVAWFAHNAAYWVRNTLTDGLTNPQMLAIAEHTAPVIGIAADSVKKDVQQQTAAPSTVASTTDNGTFHNIGLVGGIAALLLSAIGAVVLLIQRFRIGELRHETVAAAEQVHALEERVARLTGRSGAGGRGGSGGPAGAGGAGSTGGTGGQGHGAMPADANVYARSKRAARRGDPGLSS